MNTPSFPEDRITDVAQLEERLSKPHQSEIETMRQIEGDVLVLGIGGKMGPTLARMIRRASDAAGVSRRVIGVSRFSDRRLQEELHAQGIETIRCDLLDRQQLGLLPEVTNVFYLPAVKFGATGRQPLSWATNTYLPGMVCEKFRRSRIVAFSTGNVYPMVSPESGGSTEDDPPGPIGDYAMSCLGRERIFTYFSDRFGVPVVLIRLNYAHELRYGVLTDLARQILAGQAVDLSMGYFNAIWQRDANAMALQALAHAAAPPLVVNVAGPEILRVRDVALQLGQLLDRTVQLTGSEAPDALLSNGSRGYQLFGRPSVSAQQMIRWVADWQRRGGPILGKPTKFQVRDGAF